MKLEERLRMSEHEKEQTRLMINVCKQKINDSNENMKETNKMFIERNKELSVGKHHLEHQLSLHMQTNDVLSQQIINLKSTLQSMENDKKLRKESLNSLKMENEKLQLENCNRKSIAEQMRISMETLKHEFRIAIKEMESEKCELQKTHQISKSDVNDLKQLLQCSLHSERRLKKTVLELNTVVRKQNQAFLNMKKDFSVIEKQVKCLKDEKQQLLNQNQNIRTLKINLESKLQHEQQIQKDFQIEKQQYVRKLQTTEIKIKTLEKSKIQLK